MEQFKTTLNAITEFIYKMFGGSVPENSGTKDSEPCIPDLDGLANAEKEHLNKYGVQLILGPKTVEELRGDYTIIELDLIVVEGKNKPIRIYTIISSSDKPNELCHKRFLQFYRRGDWDMAIQCAIELQKKFNGELKQYYSTMIDRMYELQKSNPDCWGGVYISLVK